MIGWLARKFFRNEPAARELLDRTDNMWCDDDLENISVDADESIRREIGLSHMLNAVSMPSKMQTHCRSCGAAVCRSWKCEYCHTPYYGQPTMYGFPISWDEQAMIITKGVGPSIDELMARTESGGPR